MGREKYVLRHIENINKEIVEPNKTYILDYYNFCKSRGLSYGRMLDYVYNLYVIARGNQKDFKQWEERDVTTVINKFIEAKFYYQYRGTKLTRIEKPYSPHKILTTKITFKVFFKWLFGNGEYPPCVRGVECKSIKGVKVSDRDVLTLADIRRMVDSCKYQRDKAYIWCLYESGGRRGEVYTIKRKDISFDDDGAVLTLQTEKTQKRVESFNPLRKVRIKYGAYEMAMWLNAHPDKSPEAYIWIGQGRRNQNKLITIDSFSHIVKKAAFDAGLSKKTWIHLFRHSRATELAPKLSDQAMRMYFGWSKNSDMPGHYAHITDNRVDEVLLESVYGVTKAKNTIQPAITCPQCKFRQADSESTEFCRGCGFPFKSEIAIELLKRRKKAEEILTIAAKYPEFMDVVEKIIRKENLSW